METSQLSMVDIYDGYLDIRCSYARRVKFYRNEMYKLRLDYAETQIHDKEYFMKLCPLNREKVNINLAYKKEISDYIASIPEIYQKVICNFQIDLV